MRTGRRRSFAVEKAVDLEGMENYGDDRYQALGEIADYSEELTHVVVSGVEVGHKKVDVDTSQRDGTDKLQSIQGHELEGQRSLPPVLSLFDLDLGVASCRGDALLMMNACVLGHLSRSVFGDNR